jgi:hypothetical protein
MGAIQKDGRQCENCALTLPSRGTSKGYRPRPPLMSNVRRLEAVLRMTAEAFKKLSKWGHASKATSPEQLAERLRCETERAINEFQALPEGPIPCRDREGFSRVAISIPLSRELFDQLMNGASGYRAHYASRIDQGGAYNRLLVDVVAPLVIDASHLYCGKFDQEYCTRSLLGSYSKFWYTNEISDKSAEPRLLQFQEELVVPAWVNYWKGKSAPRKGLLAPMPEEPGVLLNGTFIDTAGQEYEQKPFRSRELHESDWT